MGNCDLCNKCLPYTSSSLVSETEKLFYTENGHLLTPAFPQKFHYKYLCSRCMEDLFEKRDLRIYGDSILGNYADKYIDLGEEIKKIDKYSLEILEGKLAKYKVVIPFLEKEIRKLRE